MEFKEAIGKLISKYEVKIIQDIFLSYSILSDYVKSNFENKRLVELFIAILKKDKGYLYCKKHSFNESKKYLLTIEKNYINDYSKQEYENVSDVLLKLTHNVKVINNVDIKENKFFDLIDIIKINVSCLNCEILNSVDDELELFVNNKKINLEIKDYIKKRSIIDLKLKYLNKKVRLLLPIKKYKLLEIITENSDIKVINDQSTEFGFDNIKISNVNGDIKVFSDSNNLYLQTINGNIIYQGKTNNLRQNTTNGNVLSALKIDNQNLEVHSKTINGDIKVGFIGLKEEFYSKLLNNSSNLRYKINYGDKDIDLNLSTINGCICI